MILADGGLSTSWREVRPSMRLGLSLATLGVAVSVTIVALGAHFLLGLSWELAVLLGAVTSPTDAAAVFSVLRGLPLSPRLVGVLEAESGLNDAPDRRPGHPDLDRRRRRARAAVHAAAIIVFELAGRRLSSAWRSASAAPG